MSTAGLLVFDLVVAAAVVGAWTAVALRGAPAPREAAARRWAAGLLGLAALLTILRLATAVTLAGRGWWFAQEKLLLAVPLVAVPAAVAVAGAGAWREGAPRYAAAAAAYGAGAGLVATLVVGYPLTAPAAASLVLAWATATALTWGGAPRLARVGAVAVAVALVAALGGAWWASGRTPELATGPGAGPGVSVADLREPDGEPDRRYTLTARQATLTLPSGRRVGAWSFDGQVPGPGLRATEGELVEVVLRNHDITDGVTLHWHGYDVPNSEDGVAGVTQDAVPPGGEHTYRFRADQAGSYWYHSHQLGATAVDLGLFGPLIVDPAAPVPGTDLTVPVHSIGGVVLVGDTDRIAHHFAEPGALVRLRLVNTDDSPRRFSLPGIPYRLVAVDGHDLTGPAAVVDRSLRLGAGGRYDVTFEMPDAPVWLTVDRDPRLVVTQPGGPVPEPPAQVAAPVLDLLRYGTLDPATRPGTPDRSHAVVLDRAPRFVSGRPVYAYTVNGRAFPRVPSLVVREGELVEVTIVNRGTETHPMHLHGHHVLVVSRDGEPATGSPLWLDTVDVEPGSVWRVQFRADNPGIWLNHCHNLTHATLGMVLHVAYEGVTTQFHIGDHNHPE